MLLPFLLFGITVILIAFAAVIRHHNVHLPPRSDSLAAWTGGSAFVQLSATRQPRHRPAPVEVSGPKHYRSKSAPAPSWKGAVRKPGRHAFPELVNTHRIPESVSPPRAGR